jgi:MSHA biogenesis protein MshQ
VGIRTLLLKLSQKFRSLTIIPWVAIGILIPFTSALADWSSTFKEGVNNFDSSGTITLNTAKIINAPNNKKLPTENYTQEGDSDFESCISANGNGNGNSNVCRKGGTLAALPSGRIDFSQCLSSSLVDLGPPSDANKIISIAQGEYRNVSVANVGDRKIIFTTDNGKYKIKSLSASSGTIEFSSGQYWIESLSINNGVKLIFPTTGRVTFFIKNDYIQKNLTIASSPENLLFYHFGKFEIEGGASLNAYVVSESTVTINGSAKIKGAVTGKDIILRGGSSVTFADTANLIDVIPDCTLEIETPLTCFTDDFNRTSVGDDWALKVFGSSLPPAIVNNRLRFTSASGNQATSSTYQRLFPAAGNLVELEFDYYAWSKESGTGADGIAIILSDASITPQPGSFGGALGYAQRDNGTPGFAGGWLGIALDEYGNFSSPNEGKVGGSGFRAQAVAIRGSSGTNYRYLTGTNANISPKIDVRSTSSAQPNHKYKIIIDSRTSGKAMVSVLRDTLNRGNPTDYVTLIAPFDALSFSGQALVPKDFYLSITGSTGGSNNNHEMDNFKVCALKSNPVGQQIHHFEFDYTSSPLTCKAEAMTVRACKDAACNLFTDPVEANLSLAPNTNGAWYVDANKTNVVKFENGSATVALRNNVITPITIGVTSSVPSTIAGSNTLCRSGSGALNTASCTLSFAESGFIFDVPDKLANKPTGNISISAVKTSDITQQCVPLFSKTTKAVDFWSSYINPITPISGQAITVNNTVVGKQSRAATTLALAFDDTGKAHIDVNYPDAGKMQLDAKYTGTGDEQGLVMIGSDQFVSFSVGLCVTPSAEKSAAECSAGNSTCTVYKKAGESFDLIIQGKAWQADGDTNYCDNLNTPNYSHTNIVLGHQLVDPVGGVLGAVGSSKYNHVAQTTNSNTVSQSVTEVGVFKFTANPPIPYLGSSFYDIPLAASPNIGRFVPDSFVVSSSSVLPSCGSFTYMDQPFDLTLTLSAVNTGTDPNTNVTQNYQGDFAKATASLVGENANDGVDLSGRLSDLPINAGSWASGQASVGLDYKANFRRTAAPSVDGPFSQLAIGVQVFDNEATNVSFIASPDMRVGSLGLCADSNCAKQLSIENFLHGRVVMDNTYGPENEILRMPTYAQYWNGSDWITNIDDSCTHVIDALDGTEIYAPSLSSGQMVTRSDGDGDNSVNISMNSGQLALLWQNTGSAAYRGQVTAPLQVDGWLKWYWDEASPTQLYEPRASAFLGRYRGHDRIIYWREVGQ